MDALLPTLSLVNSTIYDFLNNYHIALIPLFIAMGNLAARSGIIRELYSFLSYFLRKIPGGLAMATILGCGSFSAVSGSSVVCAATLSRITIPEMLKYGYKPSFSAAVSAAGGTLGSLIPPSILLIIYSYFSQQSVKQLFLAAIIPGIITLIGYCLVIYFKFKFSPESQKIKKFSSKVELPSFLKLFPLLLLFVIISGIYFGFFTPTESAAVSLLLVIVVGFLKKTLTWTTLWDSLKESVHQTSIIFAIAVGAKLLVTFLTITRLIPSLLELITELSFHSWSILLLVVLVYLILGMFLDSIGILVLTLPFTIALAENFHWDLIWFGVLVIKLLEVGLITPPIGLNVFVIQTAFPEVAKSSQIFQQLKLFLLSDLAIILFIILFPTATIFLALL